MTETTDSKTVSIPGACRALTAQVPTSQVDIISFQLWELGIQGLQELPMNAQLYSPQLGTEMREPQGVEDWTKDEKLVEGPQARIKIFYEDTKEDSEKFNKFFTDHNFVIEREDVLIPKDYLEEYRRSVRGATFGEAIWVGPPWVKKEPDVKSIIVDPGMAFGTGEHATTQMAVECIWERRMEGPTRVLDVGAGSGVLTLACAKWISPAELVATEIDPQAEMEIRRNAILNNIGTHEIEIYGGVASDLNLLLASQRAFDWVLSNIYGEVLARLTPQIHLLLAEGALWIATGILDGPSREVFEKAIAGKFSIKKIRERRDAAPNQAHLWLCYELQRI